MKNIRTPRTLAECSFETGYAMVELKQHKFKVSYLAWALAAIVFAAMVM